MILKDRFLTQSPPDTCCKLRKQAFGPNQSFEKLLQLAQMVYYGREYEEGKRTRQRTEATTKAIKSSLKQPEKKCPGEMGWTCYYCGKEAHLKQDCPQASKPHLAPSLQRTILEKRLPSKV